jgi:CubicO group peptidase (beta-lactamase class C family)
MLVPSLSLAAIVLAMAGCRAHAPPGDLDALFSEYSCADCPGASVVVIDRGAVAFEKAYGLADLEHRTPATPRTNYRLASLTKQLTARAIELLIEQGALHLDDRVRDILPELPAATSDVRVRHLLGHSSGIWDYEDFVPADGPQVKDRDVLALVAKTDRTYFAPGTSFRYSNSGYALLALIVERKSGLSFASFLRDRVFGPLGMPATLAYESGVSTVPERAFGYAPANGKFVPSDQSTTSAVLGDGGVYSSVAELVAWDRAVDQRRGPWTAPYSFGWFVDHDAGELRLSHHGETCGFTNAILKYPDRHLTVIVLTNRRGGEPWRIAQTLADRWLGRAPRDGRWLFETTPNAH